MPLFIYNMISTDQTFYIIIAFQIINIVLVSVAILIFLLKFTKHSRPFIPLPQDDYGHDSFYP